MSRTVVIVFTAPERRSVSAMWCFVATGRIVAFATSAIASSAAIRYIATL